MPKRPTSLLLVLSCLLWTVLPARAEGAELLVSAASSLTNAFTEAAAAFEARNPGVKVLLNFAASGTLLQQLDKGAPVDVFASADQETMARAEAKRLLLPGTRRDFARNDLVVVVPGDAKIVPAGLRDLEGPEVKRIALGDPGFVPAGRYAQQALQAARLWGVLQPRLIFANNVRQVLDYVQRGEVDAGFAFRTDAYVLGRKVREAFRAEGHQPILYPIAAVAGSKRAELSSRFIGFVSGPEGRALLRRYGFRDP